MQNKLKPYLGISGITNEREIISISKSWNESGLKENYDLYLGFLVSYSQIGWPISPNPRNINLFKISTLCQHIQDNSIKKIIHYYSIKNNAFDNELNELIQLYNLGNLFDGIQLNVENPSSNSIMQVKNMFKETILQMNNTNMKLYRNYVLDQNIDRILLDSSRGKGVPFNIENIVERRNLILTHNKDANIGIAGGIDPDVNLSELLLHFPRHSYDIESKIRSADGYEILLAKVKKYFEIVGEQFH